MSVDSNICLEYISDFEWKGVIPVTEIFTRLQSYISQKVKIVLDTGMSWKKKIFEGILERVGNEGIKIRLRTQKILDIPYHEFDDGNPESPGIQEIQLGKRTIYKRVGISYDL